MIIIIIITIISCKSGGSSNSSSVVRCCMLLLSINTKKIKCRLTDISPGVLSVLMRCERQASQTLSGDMFTGWLPTAINQSGGWAVAAATQAVLCAADSCNAHLPPKMWMVLTRPAVGSHRNASSATPSPLVSITDWFINYSCFFASQERWSYGAVSDCLG